MKPSRTIYRDNHKGFAIEVSVHPGYDRAEIFCFYIYLLKEMFPSEYHADLTQEVTATEFGTLMQPYAECLRDLDWSGGMTFYEISTSTMSPFTMIKAGCDYNHLWDIGRTYHPDGVMRDAKNCVDSLILKFPTLKTSEQLWKEYRAPFEAKRLEKEHVTRSR